MSYLADLYKQERAAQSGSMIYQPTPTPAPRPSIYASTPPKALSDYASSAPPSRYAQRAGESDEAFTSRLQGIGLNHLAETLPRPEIVAVAGEYNAAVERLASGALNHDQLRAQLSARAEGTGRGIMGTGTPQDRASVLGSRFGGREIAKQGGLADSIGPAPARVDMAAAWERQRLPVYAQRQEIPTGSSGTGFLGVDRG